MSYEEASLHLYKKLITNLELKRGRSYLSSLPMGRAIRFFAPCGIVTEAFLTNPRVAHPVMCEITRGLAWALFGCHVISLGRTSLSALLFIHRIGSQEYVIGDAIRFTRADRASTNDSRSDAYVYPDLSDDEENTLMPDRSNNDWWARYYAKEDHMKNSVSIQ